jgi:endonuclease-3
MSAALKRRTRQIIAELARLYPDARCALDYRNALELLIATILSAQCTDKLINKLTPALFARYSDARAYADAKPAELESFIRSASFFRTKARNIIVCCQKIVAEHHGEVPRTMEELTALPGVGRKTANVVLGNVFAVPGIPVDTHMRRLSQRMELTIQQDPVKIEGDLNVLVPQTEWTNFGHRMIHHGRQVCHARKPRCESCSLSKLCPKSGVK